MCLDNASLRNMADENILLDKPVVVREGHPSSMYDVQVIQEELRDVFGDKTVISIDALDDTPTLVSVEDFNARFSRNEWSLGLSALFAYSDAPHHPAFLSRHRFRLLHNAVRRAIHVPAGASGAGANAGCGDVAHSVYVDRGLSFSRIECSGALSGPYLDPLGGTWIRNLEGKRLCAFVPHEQLTRSVPGDSFRIRAEWWPRDVQRLVLLEPGDVLILPPNFVCAQLAVNTGVSLQGSSGTRGNGVAISQLRSGHR